MPGAEIWQMCTKCDDRCSCRNAQLSSEGKKNVEDSSNIVFPRSFSQLSAISILSESAAPDLVYKRKRLPEYCATILPGCDVKSMRTGDCLSCIHSDAPSLAGKDQYVHAQRGELSAISIMSESIAPDLVYKRRKLQENCLTTLSACDEKNPRTGDCFSFIHTDAPSLAGKEQYVHSQKGSAISIISESSAPNLVYERKKLQENCVTKLSACDVQNPRTGDCLSCVHTDAPSLSGKDQYFHPLKVNQDGPCVCNRESVIKSQSYLGLSVDGELVSDKAPKASVPKGLEVDSVNDSCSSSKSNMVNISTSNKTEVDETAECSSSSAMVMEAVGDLSEKDFCISILKSHGLLREIQNTRSCGSAEDSDTSSSKSCQRSCKLCNRSETALKLLICDNCEEAFHMSCCQPRIKKVPIDEWFCHSCLTEKHTLLKERVTRKFPNITSVMSRSASSKDDVNPILLMLRDTEPYRTSIRVGKGFQADVPDWSGPVNNDDIGEPLELHPSEYARLHEFNSSKPSKVRSISNWIQCREVLDPESGIRCGKWRRAPLFEVQTKDWECFCSILWDPSHADCNVPQELETDEVLKQLKYVETLRPRLSAQQHDLGCANSTGDLQNRRVDTKSIQTL